MSLLFKVEKNRGASTGPIEAAARRLESLVDPLASVAGPKAAADAIEPVRSPTPRHAAAPVPGGRAHLKLRPIATPDRTKRVVFSRTGAESVVFWGYESDLSMDCGKCGAALIVGVAPAEVRGIVVRCDRCGAYNATPFD